jgi:hypothetical protein
MANAQPTAVCLPSVLSIPTPPKPAASRVATARISLVGHEMGRLKACEVVRCTMCQLQPHKYQHWVIEAWTSTVKLSTALRQCGNGKLQARVLVAQPSAL